MNLEDDFSKENFQEVINEINLFSDNLSPLDFKSQTITLKDVPAGDFTVGHSLGKIPEFKMILKQIGGGYITDQNKNNTDKLMFLNNSGSIITELKILVA